MISRNRFFGAAGEVEVSDELMVILKCLIETSVSLLDIAKQTDTSLSLVQGHAALLAQQGFIERHGSMLSLTIEGRVLLNALA